MMRLPWVIRNFMCRLSHCGDYRGMRTMDLRAPRFSSGESAITI